MSQYDKARAFAMRLLKYRSRSTAELRSRLLRKGFEAAAVSEVLEYLKEFKLVDDESFAQQWVQERAEHKLIGPERLRYELRAKGIDKNKIEQAIRQQFSSISREKELAIRLIRRKLSAYKSLGSSELRPKIYNLLRRHGFSADVILELLSEEGLKYV